MKPDGAKSATLVTRCALMALWAVATAVGSAAPRLAGAQAWTLSANPVLTIGASGDSTAEFNRIAGVARLASGSIAVTTARPPEIRLFDSRGAFLRRVARPGAGPGELGVLWWVGRSGDSLLTYDFTQQRITIFDVPRERVETIPFVASGASARLVVIGWLGDADWLVSTAQPFPRTHPGGPFRDSTMIGTWNRLSGHANLTGSFPNLALFAHNGPGGSSFAFDLLSANTSIVAVGDAIWVGNPDEPGITILDRAGRAVSRIAMPLPPRATSNAAVGMERNRQLAVMKDAGDSARTTAMFAIDRRGGALPRFARLFAGSDGLVWLEAFRVSRSEATEYVAMDRQGRVVGRLNGPPSVRFLDMGDDYALGVHRDNDDVESVVLYQVRK